MSMLIDPYRFSLAPPPVTVDQYKQALFTGNGGGTRSIAGADMSAGGIVWTKSRGSAEQHRIFWSPDGSAIGLLNPAAQTANAAGSATFDASGINLTSSTGNTNALNYVYWFLKKAAGFLDVVTYTGNGANRTIAHALGANVAAILVKRTSGSSDWILYHRDMGATKYQYFNAALGDQTSATHWQNTAPTSSVFSLGTSSEVNANGATYVAFVFAHDPSGVIQGYTYTGNGAAPGADETLGWNPQFLLSIPNASQNKQIVDTGRTPGFTGNDEILNAMQATAATTSYNCVQAATNGFAPRTAADVAFDWNVNSRVYYGLAIRAP